MIATNCGKCCFLTKSIHGLKCAAGQFCNINEGQQVVTPGCCKLQRSSKWEQKQLAGKSTEDLLKTVREEMGLRFNLVVIFDEQVHTSEFLEKTLNDTWYHKFCSEIIVADLTGNEKREGLSIDFVKQYDGPTKIKTDCVVEHGESHPAAIRRVVKLFAKKGNYLMVVPAGQKISNLDKLDQHLRNVDTRVAFWHFPIRCGNTTLVEKYPYYGLYLLKPYLCFSRPFLAIQEGAEPVANDEPFCAELQKYENELGLSLCWLFDRCKLV